MNQSKRIAFPYRMMVLTLFAAFCVFLCGCGEKVKEKKVYQVGIVSGAETFIDIADGFKAKMTELGYVEGENIVYDLHKLNADPEGEKRVVEKFVEDKVDLIFAFPTDPAVVAKSATQTTDIPVVFAMSGIEETNLVEKVSRPGGNITGVRFANTELTVKRFEILHEMFPQAKRIYLIYDRNYPTAPFALRALRPAAVSMGLTLVEDPINNLEELKAKLQARSELDDIGIDAVLIMPDILNNAPPGFNSIIKFADQHKIPVGGGMDFTADFGALFSFVPDNVDQGKLAAIMADKILRGTSAGTIPVVTPNARLRLNYKVAEELGLKVPEGLLSRADEIIR